MTIFGPFLDHLYFRYNYEIGKRLDHLKSFWTILDQSMNFLIQDYLWLFKTTIQNLLVTLQKCCYLPQKSTRRQDVIEYHLTTRAEQELSNEMKQKIRQRSLPILPSSTSSPSDNLFRNSVINSSKNQVKQKRRKKLKNSTFRSKIVIFKQGSRN